MSASVPESPSGLRNAEPAVGDTKRHHGRVTARTPHPPSPSAAVALEAKAGHRSSPSPPQTPLPCNFSPLPWLPAPNPKPPFPSCSTALAPPLAWVWEVWGAAGGRHVPAHPAPRALLLMRLRWLLEVWESSVACWWLASTGLVAMMLSLYLFIRDSLALSLPRREESKATSFRDKDRKKKKRREARKRFPSMDPQHPCKVTVAGGPVCPVHQAHKNTEVQHSPSSQGTSAYPGLQRKSLESCGNHSMAFPNCALTKRVSLVWLIWQYGQQVSVLRASNNLSW